MSLTNEQILRYSRHLIMPEVGVEGQEKLVNSNILLIGAGGLGSPLAMYLSAVGIGHLGLVDFDKVDHTNLHRQVIHSTQSVGMPKVESAKRRIAEINPNVRVDTYETPITTDNIMNIIKGYDIVIDGTDNFPTRYLVNDACVFTNKPNIYGSIFRFEGQATVFYPGKGPCYRCLYPEPPPPGEVPSCAEGGVLGVLPGIVGLIQATECIKLIIGMGNPLIGRLLLFNALEMKFREVRLRRQPNCPVCGDNPTIKELINYQEFCGMGRGEEKKEENQEENQTWDITVSELQEVISSGRKMTIVDVREKEEWEICHIPGAKLIPLSTIPQRMVELDTADEIVLHCHHGTRSMKALQFLNKMGFKKLKNLRGGIDAWSVEIDPTVPRY